MVAAVPATAVLPGDAAAMAAAAAPAAATGGRTEDAWQSRCLELEWSLQKFRDQAQNIREMLREKVSEILIINFSMGNAEITRIFN